MRQHVGRLPSCDGFRTSSKKFLKKDFGVYRVHRSGFLPKKWLFGLKNCGSFVLQKTRKNGHLKVARQRIYYHTTKAKTIIISQKTTLISTEELQSRDSDLTIVSHLLQHKGATIFQTKQPLFWQKNVKMSLPREGLVV